MKKNYLITLVVAVAALCLVSCKCTENKEQKELGESTAELVVENAMSLDKQTMYLKYNSSDYRWYETGVVLKNWLDEENDGEIEMVVNVFQTVIESGSSFDTKVYKIQHTAEGVYEEAIDGFWIEDYPMNDEAIKVTFKEAFDKVMAVNLPKPHTHQVVLRKQVGPVDANPQWIFGNLRSQIYVDAITGEVSSENPAFKGLGFKMPLGEWP